MSAAPLIVSPPAGVEAEFLLPPPRPIPDELREGRHAKQRATAVWFTALLALACAGIWFLGQGSRAVFYFVALPYLGYVAAVLGLGALAGALLGRVLPGPYRYVRDGIPVRARVLDVQLVVAATHNGVPSGWRYDCLVEYTDPEGQRRQRVVCSPVVDAHVRDKLETPLRVGDEVTAVGLPGRFEQSLVLYGFLQLSPRVDFLQRRGQDVAAVRPPLEALKVLALVLVLVGLLGAVATSRSLLPWSLPDHVDPWRAGTAAGAVFVVGVVLTELWVRRTERRRLAALEEKNAAARSEGRPVEGFTPVVARGPFRVVLAVAGGFVPVMLGVLALAGVNAGLDRSPARFEAVVVDAYRQETTLLVFRSYEVKYTRADGKKDAIGVPIERLYVLSTLSRGRGALEWHQGRLGMPWVRTVYPVALGDGEKPSHVLLERGERVPLSATGASAR